MGRGARGRGEVGVGRGASRRVEARRRLTFEDVELRTLGADSRELGLRGGDALGQLLWVPSLKTQTSRHNSAHIAT